MNPSHDAGADTPPGGTVTVLLQAFQQGDREAVGQLWGRYFDRMVRLARQKLGLAPRRAADEEDVALSAFDSFCQGLESGRFDRLENRDDLWHLLIVLTVRKAINLIEREARQKRGGGAAAVTGPEALQVLVGREPPAAVAAAMNEECDRLLGVLGDDTLRKLVVLKLEGHTNDECAAQLNCARATVYRMLNLTRQIWQQEVQA